VVVSEECPPLLRAVPEREEHVGHEAGLVFDLPDAFGDVRGKVVDLGDLEPADRAVGAGLGRHLLTSLVARWHTQPSGICPVAINSPSRAWASGSSAVSAWG